MAQETENTAVVEDTEPQAGVADTSAASETEPSAEMLAKAQEILDSSGDGLLGKPKADEVDAAQEETPAAKPEKSEKKDAKKAGKDEKPEEETKPAILSWRREQAANRMGWDADYLESLGDARDEMLDKAADALDAISGKMAEAGRARAADAGEGGEKDVDAVEFDPDTPFEFADVEDTFDDATREMVLEPLANELNAMKQYVGQLQEQIAGVMPYVQKQMDAEAAREDAEIEDFFEDHEKTFGDIFGKGPTLDYAEDAKERKMREAVVADAFAMQAVYAQRGEPLTLKDALNRALSVRHQDRIKELAVREKAAKVKRRERLITQRTTAVRTTKTSSAEQRAVDAIARRAVEMGMFP